MVTNEKIPTWALSYLVNGDPTNLTEEDRMMIDEWIYDNDVTGVYPESDCEYFTSYPAFGLPTTVCDCVVTIF